MTLPEPYHLHPVAVHFPIALLTAGLAAALYRAARGGPTWLNEAVSWLLWLGALSAWAAFGLGLLAQESAPHVPPAWETLADHETLAHWTVGLFTALSIWRIWMHRKGYRAGRGAALAFIAAWLAAAGVLAKTAHLGGRLVYTHGMGVDAGEEE